MQSASPTKALPCAAPPKDLAEQKFRKSRRKAFEAPTAYSRMSGDEGENSPVNCFRPRSNENRELKKGLRPDTQRPYFRKGTLPNQSPCSCHSLLRSTLAEQKFCQTRRKGGRALTAYSPYAEVHGRPTTKYDGIYAREIRRGTARPASPPSRARRIHTPRRPRPCGPWSRAPRRSARSARGGSERRSC